MLKNWTVTTKQILKQSSGFQNHINYLVDKNRSSHENTRFVVLNNAARNIIEEIENRKEYRREVGLRGGGVSNYATSFCLNLPRDIKQPTDEEWEKIGNLVIERLAKINKLDADKLKKLTHLVIHDESSGDKNNHLNMTVSNVYGNNVIKGITQFRSTHGVKMAFNDAVRDVLGVDNFSYIPEKPNRGKVPLWKAREEKAKDAEKRAENAEKKAEKATKFIKEQKTRFEAMKAQASLLKESFKEWFHKVMDNEPAKPEAVKVAETLDEMNWDTPPELLDLEENLEPALEEPDKVSNKRKRRRRKKP